MPERRELTFEDFRNENGHTYWWATDVMVMLGYADMKSFDKVLSKVNKAMMSLGINAFSEDIVRSDREIEGHTKIDYKLSRFACYLSAMNADVQKVEVATAQAYFAEQTRKFEIYIQSSNEIDRIISRQELVDGNKSLMSQAKKAGVKDYANFQNAGYKGLYNMDNWQLAKRRRIDKTQLLETMGKTELAANIFRAAMTKERIEVRNISGQAKLEQAHYDVGKEVRDFVQKNTGKSPEELPQERTLEEIKKELKTGHKKMLKEDKKKKSK